MVSTYLSYNLVVRNLKQSLTRVADQAQVARDAAYYKDNIGKVKSLDEFMKNDRLYQYAMTAYGLEDMIYAKAFMKKVLQSDLTDSSSFANSLTDSRYRDFAAAFSFSSGDKAIAQTTVQTDEMVDLYNTTIQNQSDALAEETRYYNIAIDSVKSVDDVLNNDRLRGYVFTVFGIDENSWSRETVRNLMSSDPDDPNSYVNTTWGPRLLDLNSRITQANSEISDATTKIADYQTQLQQDGADVADLNARISEQQLIVSGRTSQITSYNNSIAAINNYFDLAAAFDFSADGTVPSGSTAQTADKKSAMNELYVLANPRVTPSAALLNKQYFEQKVASARTVDELFGDPFDQRIFDFLNAAYGINAIVPSTIENILTSDRDPDNASSYVNMAGSKKDAYLALMNAFNFKQDGTLDTGVSAQTADQTKQTTNYYMAAYNDKDDAADEAAIKQYKSGLTNVTSLDTFMSTSTVYNFALKAVGLDPTKVSTLTIKNVLKSDLNDPKSYVYTLKDDRYVQLAKAFNFDAKGNLTTPLAVQSTVAITQIAKDYIIAKTKFASSSEKDALRKTAESEAQYYQDNIGKIDSVSELLADRKLMNVVLTAKGIDPKTVTDDYLKKIFASDLNDPKSFANTEKDDRFAEIAASFNFDAKGNVTRLEAGTVQQRGQLLETQHKYLQQTLEVQQGEENAGVRLALYFERKAGDITSAYDILGDTALAEVFRTTYSLPDEIANMDIDQQAKLVEKYMTLSELSDPDKLAKLLQRFTVMYDLKNSGGTDNPVLALFSNSGASISGDTLMAIAQLRSGY
ncbi:MAG: hypothetical protein BGO05_03090 [Rhizobiales bacterium 63-7]|nr:DUF1217 domain-containing protein [Hyphomicrobiales bacterium]OJU68107.1 MAG: hypothetical protein BGO05_03090 [Rhizobiales bacterium 63-7]